MRALLRISDAAIIALHAVDLMGKDPGRRHNAAAIAANLGISYNHLSKVMQRLTKSGFVTPLRGPRGGFTLAKKAEGAALRDILEAIEGPLYFSECLMENKALPGAASSVYSRRTAKVCGRSNCLFSGLLADTNLRLKKILTQKVSAFARKR
jgi:Rrf2 family protein